MGLTDKVTGKIKQAAGDLTDDPSLRREGTKEKRKGEAKSARAAPQKSLPLPSSSKIGPGDINSRRRRVGAVAFKPANGGISFCRVASSDLRSTGSLASSTREFTTRGSMPVSWVAHPGARNASAMRSGSRSKRARSRSSGSRVSSES